jgi:hypothetical protein
VEVVTYEPESARADLSIPLFPIRNFARFAQHRLLGLSGPCFANAHRITFVWAAAGCTLAAVGFPLPSPWQRPVVGCSALVGLYISVRVVCLAAFERRQHTFELEWLAARSEVLRSHFFEILRLTVQSLAQEDEAPRRTYDLTRPADVGELIRLRAAERGRKRQASQVTIEFRYLAGDSTQALGEVHRELPELSIVAGTPGSRYAWIRFPEARYVPRPARGGYPAQQTDWELSGRVVITVGEASYGGPTGAADAATDASGLGSAR